MRSHKLKKFTSKAEFKMSSGLHANPVVDSILRLRGIETSADIEYQLRDLLPISSMKGVEDAAEILLRHIRANNKILIIGDFDCDGATATTIAVDGLKQLGATDVEFLIPDRKKHGYGLTLGIIEEAAKRSPRLIVTVDNGITSVDGVEAIHQLEPACEVIITDHHLPGDGGLPKAEAIVNPNQPECEFKSKAIAGCGVMFYTILALRSLMVREGLFKGNEVPNLYNLLDVLALGTVADVVPLDKNNRILVDAGLKWINSGRARPGIRALIEVSKRKYPLVSSDMGFALGPRLNAAGRLVDMSIGIRCLLADEIGAPKLANELNELNEARKEMTRTLTEQARDAVVDDGYLDKAWGIAVYLEGAHEGIIGISAGRGKEQTYRPFICFTDAKTPGQLKGSARSVDGINIRHVLDAVNAEDEDVFVKYGGHAMAAGMEIRKEKLADFQRLFSEKCAHDMRRIMQVQKPEEIRGDVLGDIWVPHEFLSINTAREIQAMGPWGAAFEEPLFLGEFVLSQYRVMKDVHLKLTLMSPETGQSFEAVWFNCIDNGLLPFYVGSTVTLSYKLGVNEWQGRESLQLMVDQFQDPQWIESYSNEAEQVAVTSAAPSEIKNFAGF